MIEGPRVIGFHDAARSLMGHRALGLAARRPPCYSPLPAQPAGVCFWGPGIETHAGLMIEGGSTYFSHHGNE